MKKENVFEKINSWIRGIEGSFINLIAAISPWGAPTPVAYMTFDHCLNALKFPAWIAFITAMVVEALGISSISTTLSFWAHNKTYTGKDQKAPFWLAVGTFLFYIIVVLTLNVVIDIELKTSTNGMIFARALLSLISIPAGVLLATRAQQTELISKITVDTITDQQRTDEQNRIQNQQAQQALELEEKRIQKERDDEHLKFLEQQEVEKQIRLEQAEERERILKAQLEHKARMAAIRRGIFPAESFVKVSESLQNPLDESSNFQNFPRNWRKMTDQNKQQLAQFIADHGPDETSNTLNVTPNTVKNWTRDLVNEGYLS